MTPEELLQTACDVVFWVGLLIFLVSSSLVVTGRFLGLVIFTVSLVATGRTEYFSASTMRAIQLGRKSMKTSPCVPDAALSGELVYVSCKLSGSKALGSGITGMRDLPEAERLGLRLESTCEVKEWIYTGRDKDENTGNYAHVWTTPYESAPWPFLADQMSCQWQNGGSWWPYFAGHQCINTDPRRQPWWTSDMDVDRCDSLYNRRGVHTIDCMPWYVAEYADVSVGGFRVPRDLQDQMGDPEQPLQPGINCSRASHCPTGAHVEWMHSGPSTWLSPAPLESYLVLDDLVGPRTSPTPMRRQFRMVKGPSHASFIAKQTCSRSGTCSLEPWASPRDPHYGLFHVMDGVVSAEDMLLTAEGEQMTATWTMRLATTLGACFGMASILLLQDANVGAPPNLQVIQTRQGLMLVDTHAEGARRRRFRIVSVGVLVGSACWLLVSATSWLVEARNEICFQCLYVPVAFGLLTGVVLLLGMALYRRMGGLERERQRERDSLRQRMRRAAETRARRDGDIESNDGRGWGNHGDGRRWSWCWCWCRGGRDAVDDIMSEREREPFGSEALERLIRECPHGKAYADECEECSARAVCTICMSVPRNVRVGPCGHACLCSACFARVMQGNKRCPVCRGVISTFTSSAEIQREPTYMDSDLLDEAEGIDLRGLD